MPKIPKTITLKQTGWLISGWVRVTLWGGQSAEIDMRSTFIPLGKLTYWKFMNSINDNGFGCESIDFAYIDVCPIFGRDYEPWDLQRSYEIELNKHRNKLVHRGI